MNEKQIKAQIIRRLPAEAFKPNPNAAWILLPILTTLVVGQAILMFRTPSLWISIPLAVVCGSTQLTLWSFAHEAAHGTMLRNRFFRRACTNLAGFFFLYPGELLERWHMAHHRHTHHPDHDPDVITLSEYRDDRFRFIRWLARLRVLNQFMYCWMANSLHANVVLWIRTRELEVFARQTWGWLRLKSVLTWTLWATLCAAAGTTGAVLGFLIPWLVANFLWASYALAHHQSSPLSETPDLLNTTVSIRTYRLFERLHLRGDLHLEHHLFPRMNWKYLGLVRAALEEIAGPRYRTISHWEAVKSATSLPLIFETSDTKVSPAETERIQLQQPSSPQQLVG